MWRAGIIFSAAWIRGGLDKNIDQRKWEDNNNWQLETMMKWVEDGE